MQVRPPPGGAVPGLELTFPYGPTVSVCVRERDRERETERESLELTFPYGVCV